MSTSILNTLDGHLRAAFTKAGLPEDLGRVIVSDRPDLAPFQCNGALPAAKQAKMNPRAIATEIVANLEGIDNIQSAEIAGPGFINLVPSKALIAARANEIADDKMAGANIVLDPKKIVIDFGGANVAKPMHVGHLRSAVIGETLKRILRFRGHTVIGDVHLGDWGLQMGHLITELQDEQPDLPYFDEGVTGDYPEESPVTMVDLARLYPAASNKAKAEPTRMERSRIATAELQAGRAGYRALLDHFITVSIAALKKGYGDLGVSFDLWKGEAAVDPLIPDMIDALIAQGITEQSDGALIIPVDENYDSEKRTGIPPVMLKARTGAVLYHTTDLATLVDRKDQINPDLILYVVDQRQAMHFDQVFRAAVLAGWYRAEQMEHLGFGTMNGPDGTPFKTRDGGVLRLEDLLSMMTEAAEARLNEAGFGAKFDAVERADIAQKIGIAALKFADLQNARTTNYIFDIERFTAFEGKTGPYLLYASVRIKSLLRSAKEKGIDASAINPVEPAEQQLILMLDRFEMALNLTEDKFIPHVLCEHVYLLAQSFSKFYADCPILAADVPKDIQSSRLALAAATLKQLEIGLDLLGIETPERM